MTGGIRRDLFGGSLREAIILVVTVAAGGGSSFAAESGTPVPLKVTAVRFWSLGDVTRVAIETSSDFTFKSDHLPNPERLFFDIAGAHADVGRKGMRVIPVGDKLLKQIRIAETHPGVTRVVLDLENSIEVVSSQLSNPDRLMIELHLPGDGPQPSLTKSIAGSKKLSDVSARPIEPDLMLPANTSVSLPAPAPLPINTAAVRTSRATQSSADPILLLPPSHAPRPRINPVELGALARLPEYPRPTQPTAPNSLLAKITPPPVDITPPPPKLISPANNSGPVSHAAKHNTESLTRVLGLKIGRVVLDAGHGGHDSGTNGPTGLLEKDVVLDVTRRLGKLVEDKLGAEVIYTRSDDTFIPLEERPRIANTKKADLFLSIHANSSVVHAVSGIETYYLNFTTSKTAMDVAARENAGAEKSISDLKDLLQKIALKDKVDESREFASRIQTAMLGPAPAKTVNKTRDRGVKKAPFIVLIGTSMPSVLAEIGFISNPQEETLMRKAEYRQKIAESLYRGVASYIETLSHFEVARHKGE